MLQRKGWLFVNRCWLCLGELKIHRRIFLSASLKTDLLSVSWILGMLSFFKTSLFPHPLVLFCVFCSWQPDLRKAVVYWPNVLGMPELLAKERIIQGEQGKDTQEINLDPLLWGWEAVDLSLNEHETENLPWIGHMAWKVSNAKKVRRTAVQGSVCNWKGGQEGLHRFIELISPLALSKRGMRYRKNTEGFMKTVRWGMGSGGVQGEDGRLGRNWKDKREKEWGMG